MGSESDRVPNLCLILKGIRAFGELTRIPLRPLTLLVGENSAGKTTLLASLGLLNQWPKFPLTPSFSQPPFDLGSYENIATYKGGRFGRAKSFHLGYERGEVGAKDFKRIDAAYERRSGRTALKTFQVGTFLSDCTISFPEEEGKIEARLVERQTGQVYKVRLHKRGSPDAELASLPELFPEGGKLEVVPEGGDQPENPAGFKSWAFEQLLGVLFGNHSLIHGRVTPFGPVRSRPWRTYDLSSDSFDPDGQNTLLKLMRLLESEASTNKTLAKRLAEFGLQSGLFAEIKAKILDASNAQSPFQLRVRTGKGPSFNVVDVGYGVSQALPVVVESLLLSRGGLVLLQQPEVHLHPRAQAALGSLFAQLAADGDQLFVIETHSDYLLDRLRIEVTRGTIAPERIQIVFLEKGNFVSTAYPMSLDAMGNVMGAPEGYRRFFLEEGDRLFSREQLPPKGE